MPILHLTLEMLLLLHISFFHSMPINIASLGNDDCVAMGWGKKKSDAEEYEVSMKQIKLPMVPNDQCQQALRDNMTIFKKFFGAFMRHIIRLNVGKEIKSFSELFIDKIFEYTFVTFEYEQTIRY